MKPEVWHCAVNGCDELDRLIELSGLVEMKRSRGLRAEERVGAKSLGEGLVGKELAKWCAPMIQLGLETERTDAVVQRMWAIVARDQQTHELDLVVERSFLMSRPRVASHVTVRSIRM
jgi:hypothetical protein